MHWIPSVSALRKPPGIDKLDGKTYGGIKLEAVIISAYEGSKANGNGNGYGVKVQDHQFDLEQWIPILTPGLFRDILICEYKAFRSDWYRDSGALGGYGRP